MATNSHPRRRPAVPSATLLSDSLIDSFQNMSIKKSDTFNTGSSSLATDLWDPLDARSGPLRSTTCPKSLEDLLIGAGDRRAADLLARVDKAIETQSKLAIGTVLSEPEVLPSLSLSKDSTSSHNKTSTRVRHSHSSDSGIGSSIADSTECIADECEAAIDDQDDGETSSQSMSTISAASEARGLSHYACQQIHKHIVKPILREESLKEFHPIIHDVPHRIGNRDIKTLRDLEKTLIFLAPDYSRSPNNYLRFCERTIRVLHTTVTTLHETDQKAPTDRAYTQGYFCDLVEQIRRYATILAATRERQAKGEKADEMDYSPDETVTLSGGMTHNGKPAELVRHKDGKAISMATNLPLTSEELASPQLAKRSMNEPIDDEVLRSMARRKKNAKPEIHTCPMPDCDKEFKRPCDLTKHVKTHERPWKCSDKNCKYFQLGWPTEKERDRHVNDKHSAAPALYHCLYKPCPYTSKRESNCKQHMEKAHGWQYIRSKNNGKSKGSDPMRLSRGSIPSSPSSTMLTPLTPIAPSPSGYTSSRQGSMAPPPQPTTVAGPSNWNPSPQLAVPSPEFSDHFNMDFDFNNMAAFPTFPITPAMSDDHYGTEASSGVALNELGEAITPSELDFGTNFNFDDMDFYQQTPDSAHMGLNDHSSAYQSTNCSFPSSGSAPMEPLNVGIYHEEQMHLGGFGEYARPANDFTLFGGLDRAPPSQGGEMFPEMHSTNNLGWSHFGGQFNTNDAPSLNTGNSALEDLFPELKNH